MTNGHTIIPSAPEDDFSIDEWRELTDSLRLAEPLFKKVAAELNLRLLSSARWPELRLRRHKGWTVTELRLALHPDHARNTAGGPKWAINLVRYPRFPWLPFGASEVVSIDLLGEDELNAGKRLQDCMQGAVCRAFPSLQ